MFPPSTKETFYVVFQPSDRPRLWDIFTPRAFTHVYVYKQVYFPKPSLTAARYCLKYEHLASFTEVDIYWANPREVADYLLKNTKTSSILRVSVEKTASNKYIPRGIITCVSSVKAILNLRAWWVVNPYQLWKHLINNGAEILEGK